MLSELYNALTVDSVMNFYTSVFGVMLGAGLALYGQFRLTKWQKLQAKKDDQDKLHYAALVETQMALYRQAEVIIQLKTDLLEHPDYLAARESNGLLPAYESIVEAPVVELEKITFLAQGKKGDTVNAELLHEILLAQASYQNTRLAIERHNRHEGYLRSNYPGEMIDGKLRVPLPVESYDAHAAPIRLITAHRIKGLEFDDVCLAGSSASNWKRDNLESKCLIHVAATRTKNSLKITAPGNISPLFGE